MSDIIDFYEKKNEIKNRNIHQGWKEFPIYNPNNEPILVKNISTQTYSIFDGKTYDYNDYLWIYLKEIENMIEYFSENFLA